jgi:hypothetical protein
LEADRECTLARRRLRFYVSGRDHVFDLIDNKIWRGILHHVEAAPWIITVGGPTASRVGTISAVTA